jgi:hypothetical protein
MKRMVLGWALAGLLLGSSGSAQADVIFNNFGPNNGYNTGSGYIIGTSITWVQGDAFTPTGNSFTLDRIELALGHGVGPNEIDVSLRTDAGGLPGAVLESFHFSNMGPLGQNNPPVVGDSTLHPFLAQNTQYWLIASAPDVTFIGWGFNSTNDRGPHAQSFNGGPFNVESQGTRGAFRTTGTPAIPEPGGLVLFGVGMAALLGSAWRPRLA